jgi:hypothetical protein
MILWDMCPQLDIMILIDIGFAQNHNISYVNYDLILGLPKMLGRPQCYAFGLCKFSQNHTASSVE